MHNEPTDTIRILALYVRPRRFGFAVFKGARKLLDWGGSSYRDDELLSQVSKRIRALLTIYGPSAVVVQQVPRSEQRRYGNLHPILNTIRKQAARHSATVASVGREEVCRAFRSFGTSTKYQIAAQVAVFFPVLLWKLPPPRKAWQTEHHNMAIFDAAALGLAYLSQFEKFGSCLWNSPEDFQETA